MLFFSSSSGPTLVVLLGAAVLVFLLGRMRWILARVATTAVGDVPDRGIRDESVAAVQRWWKRRLGAISIGILVGSAGSAFYVWWVGADRSGPASDLLVLGAAAGAAFACTWVGVGRRRRAPVDGPRVAHAQRMSLAGFIPTGLRVGAWVVVGGATAFIVIGAVVAVASPRFAGFSPVLPPSVLLLVIAAVSLGGFELGGRLLVSSPNSASTRAQLASDDVVRCLVVRDLAAMTLGLGLASMALNVPDLIMNLEVPFWPGTAPQLYWAAAGTGIIALVAAVIYPVWSKGPDLAIRAERSASESVAGAGPR
jgi:hypothetical protein